MVLQALLLLGALGGSIWAASEVRNVDAGEVAGDIIVGSADAVISAIPEVGSSLVNAVGDTATAVRETLQGREVAFIAGGTVLIISVASYWALKGMLLGRRWDMAAGAS